MDKLKSHKKTSLAVEEVNVKAEGLWRSQVFNESKTDLAGYKNSDKS